MAISDVREYTHLTDEGAQEMAPRALAGGVTGAPAACGVLRYSDSMTSNPQAAPSAAPARLSMQQVLICGAMVVTLSMGIRHGFGLWLAPITGERAARAPATCGAAIEVPLKVRVCPPAITPPTTGEMQPPPGAQVMFQDCAARATCSSSRGSTTGSMIGSKCGSSSSTGAGGTSSGRNSPAKSGSMGSRPEPLSNEVTCVPYSRCPRASQGCGSMRSRSGMTASAGTAAE